MIKNAFIAQAAGTGSKASPKLLQGEAI